MELSKFVQAVQVAITEAKGQVKELGFVRDFTFSIPVLVREDPTGLDVFVNHLSPGAARIEFTMHV